MSRLGGARRAVGAALVAAALVVGCSSTASTSGDPAPTTSEATGSTASTAVADGVAPEGFVAVTLLVTLPDGTVGERCVLVADTPALRSRGLMGVTDATLGGHDGMVFVFDGDATGSFWMKDTLIPLSIAWFSADGSFVGASDMEPCPPDLDRCPTYGPGVPYRYAVEVPLGGLEDLGLVAGSSVAIGERCREPATA